MGETLVIHDDGYNMMDGKLPLFQNEVSVGNILSISTSDNYKYIKATADDILALRKPVDDLLNGEYKYCPVPITDDILKILNRGMIDRQKERMRGKLSDEVINFMVPRYSENPFSLFDSIRFHIELSKIKEDSQTSIPLWSLAASAEDVSYSIHANISFIHQLQNCISVVARWTDVWFVDCMSNVLLEHLNSKISLQ